MDSPLLQLTDLRREFPAGEGTIAALRNIDLRIDAGELVAIVGASGSGKSTLMNILGCLDRPTEGRYLFAGRDVGALEANDLAALRREHFGFVFQRYHLLADLTAIENTSLPAIYSGHAPTARHKRARALLERLGLADRLHHRPSQLSGGQQQRVAIARALMNGGGVILADEPTGALDAASGEEVMRILRELNAEGHTVIIVTHDMSVAAHAQRIVEISDGAIVADRRNSSRSRRASSHQPASPQVAHSRLRASVARFGEALRMALLAMAAHRLRTFLTMLGIIIGISSVVSVVALGKGAQARVMAQIGELGTITMDVFPGSWFGDSRAAQIQTLVEADARALAGQAYVDSVSANLSTDLTARYRNRTADAQARGVGPGYFRARGLRVAQGALFDESADREMRQAAVLDEKARKALFPDERSPIGETILLGAVPVRVVGVLQPETGGFSGPTPGIYLPYRTAATRLVGKSHLENIIVRVAADVPSAAAEQAVERLLVQRHRIKDFYIHNPDQFRRAMTQANATLTLLGSAIAVIALVVGGIGVMNIMMVSVNERTREIGIRMAAGARQSDILQQFMIEAVLVCLTGGIIGLALALALGLVVALLSTEFQMIFSLPSFFLAFACSTAIGILFGFLPARSAARLDPVVALARD
ncbi:MacB family efflux pump subunit [Luteimonas gilva]|uniref:Pyoverdine export ATP-binding/permease protein PvdT n=1 Tax=Luteimonas gilva TaxID=2572684 RepID=A0A4U5JUR5_9GAMM|nr:MacB family efflux pump subunit [Luteimonas gilva]TKR33640.1 MacB family efflux pump subunit [Luteimonas gilva]